MIITDFKKNPGNYDNNVWWCYGECKKAIRQMEIDGKVEWDDYNKYIKFITDKLNI